MRALELDAGGDGGPRALDAARGLRGWLRLFHVAPRDILLQGLEATRENTLSFHVLPGRYAFIIKAHPSAFRDFAA